MSEMPTREPIVVKVSADEIDGVRAGWVARGHTAVATMTAQEIVVLGLVRMRADLRDGHRIGKVPQEAG